MKADIVKIVDPYVARFLRDVRRDLPPIEVAQPDRPTGKHARATDPSQPFSVFDESMPAFVRRQVG